MNKLSPFVAYSPLIREGDLAIVYLRHNDLAPLTVCAGTMLANACGRFKHDDFIGRPWGSRFSSHSCSPVRGVITLLHPTPELWALAVPHRTQILYLADTSLICSLLRIRPGSVVVEAGSGSGAFSHAVARSVAPQGRLHTFEFHAGRHATVRDEFESHGLLVRQNGECENESGAVVTATCRDVCVNGFPSHLNDSVDAVFLDMPAPWDALAHAKRVMRKDAISRVCCFSPCIEQVLRTGAELRALGFSEITMHELLLREEDVRRCVIKNVDSSRSLVRRPATKEFDAASGCERTFGKPRNEARGHTSYLTFAALYIDTENTKLAATED